jgi:oligoribonuclease NrnB/cAMP/cGMP phosphodiesterase (DHH superfamily)
VKYATAIQLDYFQTMTGVRVLLIDHHTTSAYLRDFDWANVNPEIDGVKTSGTSEMYRLLVEDTLCFDATEKAGMTAFAEQIRLYDTWDWDRLGLTLPRYLHELLMIIGRKEWVERFMNNIDPSLTEAELYLVETELKRINRFIKHKSKNMFKTEFEEYVMGVIYADQHHSILGNTICRENPDIDLCVIVNINDGKVSFRSVKDDVNTGEIAQTYFGGGGHPKASGWEFDMSLREYTFHHILAETIRSKREEYKIANLED